MTTATKATCRPANLMPSPPVIVVAPDKFKGSLTAPAVAAAIEQGLRRVWPDAGIRACPMADGGDGTLDTILSRGGDPRTARSLRRERRDAHGGLRTRRCAGGPHRGDRSRARSSADRSGRNGDAGRAANDARRRRAHSRVARRRNPALSRRPRRQQHQRRRRRNARSAGHAVRRRRRSRRCARRPRASPGSRAPT